AWVAAAFSVIGCSSSNSSPQASSPQDTDSGGCVGSACAAVLDGGTATPDAGEAGTTPAGTLAPLCSGNGGVGSPLPSGISLLYDGQGAASTYGATLVASGTEVFFGDQAVVRGIDVNDGSVTTYIDHSADSADFEVVAFAVDDQSVYFNDSGTSFGGMTGYGLARMPRAGAATPTTLLADTAIGNFTVAQGDGGFIYFEETDPTGDAGSAIERIPTTGGTPTVILRGVLGGVRSIAVGGGYVYFMSTIGVGSYSNLYVARVSTSAQAPGVDAGVGSDAGTDGGDADGGASVAPQGSELVAITGLETAGLAIDATNVYWGDEDKLMTATLAGGAPSMLAQADPIGGQLVMTAVIQGIAPAGNFVYWSSYGCQALRKSPIAGNAGATTVVPNVSAFSVAATATHTYFTVGTEQVLSGPL
ncbi:MAG TPA: hypothetical protein VII82_09380, partial [Polyangiaceae bacterium]